jgi:hypothetical protein
MDQSIDQKIKNLLDDFHKAHERAMEFNAKEFNPGEPIIFNDLYEMGLAYDEEERILLYLDLAYIEKYPHLYPNEQVEFIKKQIDRLSHDILAWKNRQVPSEYKG